VRPTTFLETKKRVDWLLAPILLTNHGQLLCDKPGFFGDRDYQTIATSIMYPIIQAASSS